ncbi:replication/maintenance protein RepL [Malaciobacter marinus]|jgi:predicted transcriptional regulator|uniref:replication/maintenance protein RepL n=1 Tax=Malaciobacter marinus TaxID=505249 RepID=UPI0009A7B9D9|nr:replication/maintenance protein RepL [Malaciobacter marinus]SKB57061.1 replication protein (RepL) [Malaciobacter marinus]
MKKELYINTNEFITVLERLGGKKIKVMTYLIKIMDDENKIDITQDEVVEQTGISKSIVNGAFKTLVSKGLLRKEKRKYLINSEIIKPNE